MTHTQAQATIAFFARHPWARYAVRTPAHRGASMLPVRSWGLACYLAEREARKYGVAEIRESGGLRMCRRVGHEKIGRAAE